MRIREKTQFGSAVLGVHGEKDLVITAFSVFETLKIVWSAKTQSFLFCPFRTIKCIFMFAVYTREFGFQEWCHFPPNWHVKTVLKKAVKFSRRDRKFLSSKCCNECKKKNLCK